MNWRDELLREIDLEDVRLAALQADVEEGTARLAAIRKRLAAERSAQDLSAPRARLPAVSLTRSLS